MINAKITPQIRKFALVVSHIILIFAFGCVSPTPIIIDISTATVSPSPITPSPIVLPTETQVLTPTPTSFVPRAVIKIVSHVPLSGAKASHGKDILHGAELAVQQLSGPLNEYSYKVELVSYDDQNITKTALENAQKIVADPEILCGVGQYDSDITIATSNIYHQAGLAFVAPSATAPLLTDRSYLEINRVIGRTDRQGTAAAQFAKGQGFTSVYIVTQKAGSSLRNAEYFRTESGSLGIKWLGSVISTLTPENRDKFVSQIVKAKPDLVYISSSAEQAIPFLTELRAAGYMGTFLGTERLDNQSMISSAGPSLLEGGGMYYTISNPPAQYYSDAAKFVQDFNTQYGALPLSFAARAYDATGICMKAIEEASRAKGGIPPTRAEVARAIRALKDYKGITGIYNFNNQGDPNPVRYYVLQVLSVDANSWDQNPIVAAIDVKLP
jgi:branched-chain amino acid transport system substrate-binding protein